MIASNAYFQYPLCMTETLKLAQQAVAAAKKAGSDAADALCYTSLSLSVSERLGKPEDLERSESIGIGLRVFVGKRIAAVSSTDTSPQALAELAERAVSMARLAPDDPLTSLAPEALLAKEIPDLDLWDPTEPEATTLRKSCAEAEEVALGVAGITNSMGASAGFSQSSFALATSHGFAGQYRSSQHSLSVSVVAGAGTGMERDYEYSAARFAADLDSPESIGKSAATRTLARLNPRKINTQQVPVVFDPRMARRLLGNFTGAINGASIARQTSFLKNAMGTQIFGKEIFIIDNPLRRRGLGSHPFDGEGVSAKPLELVQGGVLQSWLLDVRSANKLGLATTGHASRGLSSAPSPSTSNCNIAAGKLTPEALMADIRDGFYVTELIGMGVNLVTGDFSQGASGFWIKNGVCDFAVSEVTIAGKLQDMFRSLTPANDLVFRYATNSPTLRVEGMTVAGR